MRNVEFLIKVHHGRADMIRLLRSALTEVLCACDNDGVTVLHFAADNHRVNLAEGFGTWTEDHSDCAHTVQFLEAQHSCIPIPGAWWFALSLPSIIGPYCRGNIAESTTN